MYGAIGSLIEQMKAKQLAQGGGQPQMSEAPPPQGGLFATPQMPPDDPPQGRGLLAKAPTPEQMLAQQLSQNPVQGGPPQAGLMTEAPMPDGAPDAAHAHQKGIRGGLLHLLGADRMAPEIAAALTPEQEARVRPGLASTLYNAVFNRMGPNDVMRDRASVIVKDRDRATARAKAAQEEATLGEIRQEAQSRYPDDPQAQVEYVAQSSAARLGGVTQATQAAVGLRERAPQRVSSTTMTRVVNGVPMEVIRTSDPDGTVRLFGTGPMARVDLIASGAKIEGPPQQAAPNTFLQSENPDGTLGYTVVQGRGNVTPKALDIRRPDPASGDRTTAAVRKQVSSNRTQIRAIDETLAELERHPSAIGLHRGVPVIGDDVNQRVDPEGVLARAGIANVGSLKIHDRTGAVMSAREQPRLVPFIPGIRDTPEAARTKLLALRRWMEQETVELERGMPTDAAPAPASPASSPAPSLRTTTRTRPAGLTDAQWASFLETKGEKPR